MNEKKITNIKINETLETSNEADDLMHLDFVKSSIGS
jgi:hypothetical protein